MELAYNLGNHSPRLGSDITVADHAVAVSRAGFKLVELDDWTFDRWEDLGGDPSSLAKMLADLDLACFGFGPLRIRDSRSSLAAMDRLVAAVGPLAARWVPVVVYSDDDGRTRLIRRCAEQASDLDVGLAIEFIPWSSAPNLATARALVTEVDHPSVKLLLDVFHIGCGGASWMEIADLQSSDIAMVQLSDIVEPISDDLAFESSHRRRLPGYGQLDLPRFFETLRDIGWDGVVSLEILSDELRSADPEVVARTALHAASRYLEM